MATGKMILGSSVRVGESRMGIKGFRPGGGGAPGQNEGRTPCLCFTLSALGPLIALLFLRHLC